MEIRCTYLDDILIMNQDKELARQQTWAAINLLESLGFLINYQKSVLEPTQEITFLGFVLDSRMKLPQSKVSQIQQEAQHLLAQEKVSARVLASFIGKLSAAILAIYPAPLHYRSLQRLKHQALRVSGFDNLMIISHSAQEDLQWWINNLGSWNGRAIQESTPEIEIETDASKMSWGAYFMGEFTGGCWTQEEKTLHINALELIAATFGVQELGILQVQTSVIGTVENRQFNSSGIHQQDGRNKITYSCSASEEAMAVVHPKRNSPQSVASSREAQHHCRFPVTSSTRQIRLDSGLGTIFHDQHKIRSIGHRSVCNKISNCLPRFVSWRPDPMAEATDAFLQDWSSYTRYAYPPWCLISRVLFKALAQAATLVIVVPLWQTQAWFPQLMEMLIEAPILLPHKLGIVEPSPNCDCLVMDRVPGLRMHFKAEGISEEAISLILALWRSKTESNYDSAWKKWQTWCSSSESNPFAAGLPKVLGFLAEQFREGKQYRSLNCFRSAISSAHLPIDGFPVGKHPLVCRLLKVFNLQPPLPRYNCTWDVTKVTSYLKDVEDNEQMSLKHLTQKLAMLLAQVLAHRSSGPV